MRLYNTLTRKEEEFITNEPGIVKMLPVKATINCEPNFGTNSRT